MPRNTVTKHAYGRYGRIAKDNARIPTSFYDSESYSASTISSYCYEILIVSSGEQPEITFAQTCTGIVPRTRTQYRREHATPDQVLASPRTKRCLRVLHARVPAWSGYWSTRVLYRELDVLQKVNSNLSFLSSIYLV